MMRPACLRRDQTGTRISSGRVMSVLLFLPRTILTSRSLPMALASSRRWRSATEATGLLRSPTIISRGLSPAAAAGLSVSTDTTATARAVTYQGEARLAIGGLGQKTLVVDLDMTEFGVAASLLHSIKRLAQAFGVSDGFAVNQGLGLRHGALSDCWLWASA